MSTAATADRLTAVCARVRERCWLTLTAHALALALSVCLSVPVNPLVVVFLD